MIRWDRELSVPDDLDPDVYRPHAVDEPAVGLQDLPEHLGITDCEDVEGPNGPVPVDQDRPPGRGDRAGGRHPLAVDGDRLGAAEPQHHVENDEVSVLNERFAEVLTRLE